MRIFMAHLAEIACAPLVGANPTFPEAFGVLLADWRTVTFLALLSSLLALVLIYMLALFLRHQGLTSWCKFELFQILGTATVFIFLIVWVVGMCEFKMDFLNDSVRGIDYTGKNLYIIVDEYFQRMKGIGYLIFAYAMYVSKVIVFFQKVTYFSSPLGLGVTDNPLDSLGQLNSIIFLAMSGFVTSFLLLDLQRRMLEYMAYASMFYLFPFGIFFRAFEPTRGAGGALIGIAMSFFLFYPIILVFNDYLTRTTYNSVFDELKQAANIAEAQIEAGNVNNPEDLKKIGQLNPSDALGQMNIQDMITGTSSATIFLLKPVSLYMVGAVVLPVINFIVLVEIARGLTRMLGDELDVSNLTRLI
ncbi:MAG: hypothetical protein N3F07_03250 [Candidatus Micrarchaeota archaeon]|nr:hypothetical protein [Candidatus Micrarchaeota archaeon]